MRQSKTHPAHTQPEAPTQTTTGTSVTASPTEQSTAAEPDLGETPSSMQHLLALYEQMEKEKEAAIRQLQEEKARITALYQAQMGRLDGLLAKIAPELATPPALAVPQRTRARAEAVLAAAIQPPSSAKWDGRKFCPYCQVQGHDGRAHRGQPTATRWTRAELAAYGYLPPANQVQLPPNYP